MKSKPGPRVKQPMRFAREQSGYALLLIVLGLVLGSLAFLTRNLNANTVRLDRDEITRQALAEAKQALIGWSATQGFQPGALPCPDTNGDGYADTDIAPGDGTIDIVNTPADDITRSASALAGGYCKTPALRIGRLPWKTLGLSELRDGAGEPLWYAISDNFRRLGSRPINSDIQGQLSVSASGALVSNHVIAVIFSPGPALGGQTRGSNTDQTAVSNYLEGANADVDPGDLFEIPVKDSATSNVPSNDQLLLIDEKDLFPAVTNEVARRLKPEILPLLKFYRDQWASAPDMDKVRPLFPYAAPAVPNQPTNAFRGTLPSENKSAEGLLPASKDPSWITATADFTADPRLSNKACSSEAHAKSSDPLLIRIVCNFEYSFDSEPSDVYIQGEIYNAALSLALPLHTNDFAPQSYGVDGKVIPTVISLGSMSQQIVGNNLTFTRQVHIPAASGKASVTIPVYWLPGKYKIATGLDEGWFFDNEWYRLIYYSAVAQRLPSAPESPLSCEPGMDCLTLNGTTMLNNIEALIVMAGTPNPESPGSPRQTRPSGNMSDYWEGENASPGDRTFEKKIRSATSNDYPLVISP